MSPSEVSDEESSQYRAMNFLCSQGLRLLPIPELAHPKWGDFGRAINSADLRLSLLKGTCIVNHGRGPYGTHRFGFEAQEVAVHLTSNQPDSFFEDLADRIEFDTRSRLPDENQADTIREYWLGVLSSRIREDPWTWARQLSLRCV